MDTELEETAIEIVRKDLEDKELKLFSFTSMTIGEDGKAGFPGGLLKFNADDFACKANKNEDGTYHVTAMTMVNGSRVEFYYNVNLTKGKAKNYDFHIDRSLLGI